MRTSLAVITIFLAAILIQLTAPSTFALVLIFFLCCAACVMLLIDYDRKINGGC